MHWKRNGNEGKNNLMMSRRKKQRRGKKERSFIRCGNYCGKNNFKDEEGGEFFVVRTTLKMKKRGNFFYKNNFKDEEKKKDSSSDVELLLQKNFKYEEKGNLSPDAKNNCCKNNCKSDQN